MKKFRILVLFLLSALLLSSCKFTSFDTNTLLTAPLMSPSDQQMRKAISDAIGSTYEPIYPKSGSYQTAITPISLTDKNAKEAFCFFKATNEKYVSFVILQNQNDKWIPIGINKSQAMGVDRVDFCDITSDGKKEIIIGWQYLSGEENALEIFSLTDSGALKSEYAGMYNDFITFNNCVAVISKNSAAKTASASLIGGTGHSIGILGTVSLNNGIAGFSKIQKSEFKDNTIIFIDEQLENLTYTTELLAISTKGSISISAINLGNITSRTRGYTCIDANNDEILDLPIEREFPSYIRNGTEERLSYVDWYQITETEPKLIKSTYSSVNEPFYIELKREWIGKITIEKHETNERIIHFYSDDNKKAMFSIRVFSRQEYTDSTEKALWQEVAASGENVYTFRQDALKKSDKFYTDLETMKKLFVVLT